MNLITVICLIGLALWLVLALHAARRQSRGCCGNCRCCDVGGDCHHRPAGADSAPK